MNLFRLGGDLLHLASIFILLLKILTSKNCRGISLKTQALYLLVFVTRYIDLAYNFNSMYNWIMKVIFIGSAAVIVYLMKFKRPYCETYDAKLDTFNVLLVIVPCFLLSLKFNEYLSFTEVMWTFSVYLEAVAILPQLIVVHMFAKDHRGFVENLTSHYVFALGGYRVLYLMNWVWRYFTEYGYKHVIVWVAGVVQTLFYVDFFYYYLKAYVTSGDGRMVLPV